MPEEPMMTETQRDELKTLCAKAMCRISQARCLRRKVRSTSSKI